MLHKTRLRRLLALAILFLFAVLRVPTLDEDGTAFADPAAPIGKPIQAPIAILAYHRFDPAVPGPTTVTTRVFEAQLAWLADHHYKVVPLRVVVDGLRGKAPPVGAPAVAISVDDGHRSVYTYLFPIIRRLHIPVTLFIYPSAISHASYALTWDELKEMLASGLVAVQSHTYWHPDFRKERARLPPEKFRAFVDMQLARSKSILESQLGIKVDMLAWPFGIVDPDLEAAAARAGYVAAFAYEGGLAAPGEDLFALSRIPISNAARGASFGALLTAHPARKPNP